MRQTRLDESKKEEEESKGSAEEQAVAGSKRKEPAPVSEATPSQGKKENRTKSRKTAPSEDEQGDEDKKTRRNGDKGSSSPAKLSDDQRKVDSKLKADDVEINEGDSGSDGKQEVSWYVTEKGIVYFFYRPRVMSSDKAESNSTESLDDVQNTYMLLVPRASESDTAPASDASGGKSASKNEQDDKRKPPNPTAYRLVSLGKKRMPSPEAALKSGQDPGGIGGRHSEAIWATVADIGADLKAVADGMGEEHYSTKTRGKIAEQRIYRCCIVRMNDLSAASFSQANGSSPPSDLRDEAIMR